jgi:REP element-mobilizing transposase RayT
MQWYKTMTTNAYIRGVKNDGWPPFPGKLWQRSFYDRIIRDRQELDRIRLYIANNPANWLEDHENPAAGK